MSIEININENEIYELIVSSLRNGNSFCLSRIGDGEIAVLNRKNDLKGAKHFYYVHLGRELSEKHMEEINNNLINVIKKSDIIGIPTTYSQNSGNPYWKISRETIKNTLGNTNKKFCDMGIHYTLTHKKLLNKILNEVEDLFLVTSRDVESKIKINFPNIKNITTYKIPGEYVYEDNKKYEDFYPSIYTQIEKEFRSKKYQKKLLLLGGGFVGKNLGCIFAEQGGVSIDIGSIFDQFIGKITRGQGKGPNKYTKPILE